MSPVQLGLAVQVHEDDEDVLRAAASGVISVSGSALEAGLTGGDVCSEDPDPDDGRGPLVVVHQTWSEKQSYTSIISGLKGR